MKQSIENRIERLEKALKLDIFVPEYTQETMMLVGVYFIQAQNGLIKIGHSRNCENRFEQIKNTSPIPVWMVYFYETQSREKVEQYLHLLFDTYRVHGEWFRPDEIAQLIKTDGAIDRILSDYEKKL